MDFTRRRSTTGQERDNRIASLIRSMVEPEAMFTGLSGKTIS